MFSQSDLLIGVDIHRRNNVVHMLDGHGQPVQQGTFSNHGQGCQQLREQIATVMQDGGFERVHLAAEATGAYWLPMFCQLDDDDMQMSLYAFNPRLIANFKNALGDDDKTDKVDATAIAQRLRFGHKLPRPFTMSDHYLPLRTLTRYRFHLISELARVKNYTHSVLFQVAPTWSLPETKPFSNPFSATGRAVFSDFASLDEVARMSLDDLTEWVDKKGKRRFSDPEHNAQRLQQVAIDAFDLPKPFEAVLYDVVRFNLRHIRSLEDLLKRVDHALALQMEQIPNTLTTIPGIGAVYAAGILAEIGNMTRFDSNEAKVAAYAGLRWPKQQSGEFVAQDKQLSRRFNRFLRYYLCEAAHLVRMHAPEYRLYYDRKFREARTHHHRRAVVLTARKLVRLIVRLLTTNEPYRRREVSDS